MTPRRQSRYIHPLAVQLIMLLPACRARSALKQPPSWEACPQATAMSLPRVRRRMLVAASKPQHAHHRTAWQPTVRISTMRAEACMQWNGPPPTSLSGSSPAIARHTSRILLPHPPRLWIHLHLESRWRNSRAKAATLLSASRTCVSSSTRPSAASGLARSGRSLHVPLKRELRPARSMFRTTLRCSRMRTGR